MLQVYVSNDLTDSFREFHATPSNPLCDGMRSFIAVPPRRTLSIQTLFELSFPSKLIVRIVVSHIVLT
jgi:hypothetical protein